MKKIAIVLFVAAAALAGCGKKKAPEAPAGGTTTEPAAGSADQGSAAPAEGGEGSAAPAEGGSAM
jgi:hypothetical protein